MIRAPGALAPVLASILGAGCATLPQARPAPAPAESWTGTRVLVGECLFREGLGESAIGTALLGFALDKGLNTVGAVLRKAGEDKLTPYEGFGNYQRPTPELEGQCVTVIRGAFRNAPSIPGESPSWAAALSMTPTTLATLQNQHRVVLDRPPDFLAEAIIRRSSDGSAMVLRPLYAVLNSPAESLPIDPTGGARSVAVTISFVEPGKDLAAATNPGAELQLGRLKPGRYVRYWTRSPDSADAANPAAPAVDGQPSGDVQVAAAPYIPWPLESRWFALATDRKGPMTVRAAVVETRSGSKLAKLLSEAFEASKDEVRQAGIEALVPAERRKAELADLEAQAKLREAALTSLREALDGLNACGSAAPGDAFAERATRLQTSQTARSRQDAANRAALAAEQPAPFAQVHLVTPSAAEGVTQACRTSLAEAFARIGGERANAGDTPVPPGPPPGQED